MRIANNFENSQNTYNNGDGDGNGNGNGYGYGYSNGNGYCNGYGKYPNALL